MTGRTFHTANGVPITDGMRVWTNNVRAGRVDLSRSWEEAGKLWFDVWEDDRGPVLQSDDRVSTRHPMTGKSA